MGMIEAAALSPRLRVCAVASTPIYYLGNRWEELYEHFKVPLDANFVNVVCGFGGDLERFWTADVVNVAVTGCHPRYPGEGELGPLKKYQLVIAINRASEEFFNGVGIKSRCIPRTGAALAEYFGGLL